MGKQRKYMKIVEVIFLKEIFFENITANSHVLFLYYTFMCVNVLKEVIQNIRNI